LIVLAIDTCEARGGVAIRRKGITASFQGHFDTSDYSEWLLPAVDQTLNEAGAGMKQVDVLAAATGPGSFTGLRVGLTTVKAWAEIYDIPVVGISRLEAMALPLVQTGRFVAALYDAQRGQLFGALYSTGSGRMERIGDEVVISPEGFVNIVTELAGRGPVNWVTLDPGLIVGLEIWKAREACGDTVRTSQPKLAAAIAEIAEERAGRREFSDPLELDANYVRRSDAEIFWKGNSSVVR